MALLLTHKQSGDVYRGTNGFNRNYLTILNLIPGEYQLKIYEPHENHLDVMKCSYFTFVAIITKGGKEILINPEQPPFPAVLDFNSLSYLFYEGQTHIQGYYTLFNDDDKAESKEITFSVKEPAAIRVTMQEDAENDEIHLDLMRVGQSKPVMSQMKSLYYPNLAANQNYRVVFKKTGTASTASDLITNLEIALEPTKIVDNYVDKKSTKNKCKPLSDVVKKPIKVKQYASVHRDDLTIDPKGINPGSYTQKIGNVTFTVEKNSLVVAK